MNSGTTSRSPTTSTNTVQSMVLASVMPDCSDAAQRVRSPSRAMTISSIVTRNPVTRLSQRNRRQPAFARSQSSSRTDQNCAVLIAYGIGSTAASVPGPRHDEQHRGRQHVEHGRRDDGRVRPERGRHGRDPALAVGPHVLHGPERVRRHPPEHERDEHRPRRRRAQVRAHEHQRVQQRADEVHRGRQRVQHRALLEPEHGRGVRDDEEQDQRQGRVRGGVADQQQVDDERHRRDQARPQDPAVHLARPGGLHEAALDPALARVAQVRRVVEHVVDPVHQQVVRAEEEQGADDERRVDPPAGGQQVAGRERVRGVDPGERPGRREDLSHARSCRSPPSPADPAPPRAPASRWRRRSRRRSPPAARPRRSRRGSCPGRTRRGPTRS